MKVMQRILLRIIFALMVGLTPDYIWAQSAGILTGKVLTIAGIALEGVEVQLESQQLRKVVTDGTGKYVITELPPGRYVVTFSGREYIPNKIEVEIRSGETTRTDVRMALITASIDVVASLKEYHLEDSSIATRVNTRLIDLPQSVQIFPNQLIEDRAILEGNELFRNISGLNQNTYSSMTFRGFTQREILFNGTRGNPFGSIEGDVSNAGFSTSQIRLTNIQRVEVLKGPTSALYGSGEVGGLINYVTRKPREVLDAELQVRFGSFAQKMVNAEVTGPINQQLLARGAFYFEDRDSFRNNAGSQNSHGVGNLLYKLSDNHRLSVEAELINQLLPASRLRGVPVDASGNFLTSLNWSANEPTDLIKMIARVLQIRGEHNLARGWNLDYTMRYLEYENNDRYHEPRGLNAATPSGRTMRREYRNMFRSNDDWSFNFNAAKRSETNGFGTHTILVGSEHIAQDHRFRSARAREREVSGGTVPAIDIFNPVYGLSNERNYTLSAFAISEAQTKRTGLYAQDHLVLNRFVQLLLSGRVDRYDDRGFAIVPLRYSDTALSGRAGIVVKPVEQLSLYASYANSFARAPIFSQASDANGPFRPETGDQIEVGVKTELLDRRLSISGAFFNIEKENVLRPDPQLGPRGNNVNALLAIGAARSRGFEFNVEGFLTRRWYTAFNYANVDTLILKDNTASLIGQPLANAPRHTTGLFTRYNILEGTGIGLGLESISRRVEPFAGIRTPGYAIADLSFYQDLTPRARLQLQVTNIANRSYAVSSLFAARAGNFPGQPRAIMLTLTLTPFRK
jgi:iron complex outermembrane receptor protein